MLAKSIPYARDNDLKAIDHFKCPANHNGDVTLAINFAQLLETALVCQCGFSETLSAEATRAFADRTWTWARAISAATMS